MSFPCLANGCKYRIFSKLYDKYNDQIRESLHMNM